jgi:hypothetical protein
MLGAEVEVEVKEEVEAGAGGQMVHTIQLSYSAILIHGIALLALDFSFPP